MKKENRRKAVTISMPKDMISLFESLSGNFTVPDSDKNLACLASWRFSLKNSVFY